MNRSPRVSVYYLRWLQDYLTRHGEPMQGLNEGRSHIPMAEWQEMLDRAAERLGDDNLGLHLGQTITPARFGLMGYLLHHCENLLQVAMRLQRYLPLFFSLQQMTIRQEGDTLLTTWQADRSKPHYHEEVFAVASLVQFASALCDKDLRPLSVGLFSQAPANSQPLTDYLRCPVFFEQTTNWLRCDAALLYQPTAQPDANLRAVLEQQAEVLLETLPASDDDALSTAIRRSVLSHLQGGEPTLQHVAADLYMSTRTLHRRLAAQGQTFRGLLEQTRFELAKSYLADRRLSLADVSILLGYAEQSPFSHAFKRWAGMTPKQWRRG